jgi:hypothetical protein
MKTIRFIAATLLASVTVFGTIHASAETGSEISAPDVNAFIGKYEGREAGTGQPCEIEINARKNFLTGPRVAVTARVPQLKKELLFPALSASKWNEAIKDTKHGRFVVEGPSRRSFDNAGYEWSLEASLNNEGSLEGIAVFYDWSEGSFQSYQKNIICGNLQKVVR